MNEERFIEFRDEILNVVPQARKLAKNNAQWMFHLLLVIAVVRCLLLIARVIREYEPD